MITCRIGRFFTGRFFAAAARRIGRGGAIFLHIGRIARSRWTPR